VTASADTLRSFLDAAPAAALVEVAEANGSTPREKGAWMLVSPSAIFGTIGGGQLEFMAIDKARQLLAATSTSPSPRSSRGKGEGQRQLSRAGESVLDIPLGPEIGQCCGGRVEVAISLVDRSKREKLLDMAKADDHKRPYVYIFGCGHVGHALAASFALLPVQAIVVETRADALEGMPAGVETRLTPVPEEMVREAPAGSAFVVLTHDHALDFLIVAEALKREDAAYVGMIGSKTKKATFRSWYLKTASGTQANFSRLVSPIGGDAVRDKRPTIIAALATAEIMTALLVREPAKADS
jgi:xanthine dehydrogenase accessory factor